MPSNLGDLWVYGQDAETQQRGHPSFIQNYTENTQIIERLSTYVASYNKQMVAFHEGQRQYVQAHLWKL
jgi:hypothetical protein